MTKRKRFDSTARDSAIAVFEDELKMRSDGYVEHLSHGGKADCGEEFYLDALYMAIAALREQGNPTAMLVQQYIKVPVQPQWISVEERLPVEADANPYESILAIEKDDGFARAWCWDIVVRYPNEFTHWMPMPEPPEVSHG